MTNEARIGRARTVLGMAPMKFLAGAAAFALLVSSAWGDRRRPCMKRRSKGM